jgi:hypothetical protein
MKAATLFLVYMILLWGGLEGQGQPNAVGYLNISLKPGLNLVGRQLDSVHNTVGELYKLVDESIIYRVVEGSFTTNVFRNGNWERPDEVILPGEGIFILNPSSQAMTQTDVGQILQGDLTNFIPAGLSIRCSFPPMTGKITQDLGLKLNSFDNVYLLRGGGLTVFTFLPNGTWNPFEPTVNSGEAFEIDAGQATNWVVHFEVNQTTPANSSSQIGAQAVNGQAGVGAVNFANGAAGVNAPIRFSNNTRPTGPEWRAELWMRQGDNTFVKVKEVPFEAESLAGYFFGGAVPIAGSSPGDTATFKVRMKSVTKNFFADSEAVTVTLGGGKVPPANLLGLTAMEVPSPLELSIRTISSSELEISWADDIVSRVLESSTVPTGGWQVVTESQSTNGSSIFVKVPIINQVEIFRLRSLN